MIFLFSSFTGIPDKFFSGYAFFDADFISGSGGAAAFIEEAGREIVGGLDGCYVTIWRDSDGHHVGVDHTGYKKIFFYNDGRVWGFSNSVTRLADHLQSNGIQLHADPVQMRALKIESTLTTQLACFQTVVSGIKLLPSMCEIDIVDGLATVRYRMTRSIGNYRHTLEVFLERWVSKIETMIADSRVQVVCDLTGGKDSRIIFGLLSKAQQRLAIPDSKNCFVRSSTAKRWLSDFVAAKRSQLIFVSRLTKKFLSPWSFNP